MSIVSSYASDSAQAALRRQRTNATITSVVISILVIVLLGLLLMLILIPGFFFESPTIVAYQSQDPGEEEVQKREVNTQVQRKPSAPSSAMARVIASTTPTPTAVPVPEVNVPDPSVSFGDGNDFGEGWGSGGGSGGPGGGTTFFGQKVSAERICYVIDYSASMGGDREALMRKELSDSIGKLTEGTKYQMIFFAGPAWVGGDEVQAVPGGGKVTGTTKRAFVKSGDGEFKWKTGGGASGWDHDGKKQVPQWMDVSKSSLRESKKIVKNTQLQWGTIWRPPLEMALSMDPPPQVIYFMTDGSTGRSAMDTAEDIGRAAKRKGIIVNCVAMMVPKAVDAMEELAKRTKGQFTVVHKGGKRQLVLDADGKKPDKDKEKD
ncbi:MAG: VWA domain-containing protein [Akkermansiaceae bacterium]|nr:VWA domain-containing protein [Akkermansiaceae bacterium]